MLNISKIKIGSVKNVAIFFHWSLLLYVIRIVIDYQNLVLGFIYFALIILLILFHELGHMLFALWRKYNVDEIVIHLFGGYCRMEGDMYERDELLIASGGIIFQLLPLFIVLAISLIMRAISIDTDENAVLKVFTDIFITYNTILIFVNLLPLPGLDGSTIWRGLRSILKDKLFVKRPEFTFLKKTKAYSKKKYKKEIKKIIQDIGAKWDKDSQ